MLVAKVAHVRGRDRCRLVRRRRSSAFFVVQPVLNTHDLGRDPRAGHDPADGHRRRALPDRRGPARPGHRDDPAAQRGRHQHRARRCCSCCRSWRASCPHSWQEHVVKYLPGQAGQAIFQPHADPITLAPWAGLAVLRRATPLLALVVGAVLLGAATPDLLAVRCRDLERRGARYGVSAPHLSRSRRGRSTQDGVRTLPLAAGVAAGLVALVVGVALRAAGSSADGTADGPVAGAGLSSALTYTPVPAASLPSGLPSDPGRGRPGQHDRRRADGQQRTIGRSHRRTAGRRGARCGGPAVPALLRQLADLGPDRRRRARAVRHPRRVVGADRRARAGDTYVRVRPPGHRPVTAAQQPVAGGRRRGQGTRARDPSRGSRAEVAVRAGRPGLRDARRPCVRPAVRGQVRALVLGGKPPAGSGAQLFWTEAGHRIDISASDRAAGPAPVASSTLHVATVTSDGTLGRSRRPCRPSASAELAAERLDVQLAGVARDEHHRGHQTDGRPGPGTRGAWPGTAPPARTPPPARSPRSHRRCCRSRRWPRRRWPGVTLDAGRRVGEASSSVALAIAPKTAAPTALPIERLNMLVPVTTPRRVPADDRLHGDQGRARPSGPADADDEAGRRRPARPRGCAPSSSAAARCRRRRPRRRSSAVSRKPIRR